LKDNFHPCIGVSPGIYSYVFSELEIERQVTSYAEALDKAIEKFGFSVVFLPHYVSGFRYDDLEISKMILHKMKNKDHARIVEVEKAEEFKSFLDKMDVVISSKMHPAVLALSGLVPTLCVAYDHKQIGLFMSLDMSECVIPLNELSSGRLFSKICYVWNNKERIRAKLETHVSFIQKNIREAIKLALSQFGKVDVLGKT
jgi:polysaccharide pyruvyl transferase WcaK-like protein